MTSGEARSAPRRRPTSCPGGRTRRRRRAVEDRLSCRAIGSHAPLTSQTRDHRLTPAPELRAAIRELAAGGFAVRVNIVGFAIDELMLKKEFEGWARLGGGRYLDAADGEGLRNAVRGAIRPSFEALAGGEVVAGGTVGGDAVELPVGEYRVRTSSGEDLGAVTIAAGEETTVRPGG